MELEAALEAAGDAKPRVVHDHGSDPTCSRPRCTPRSSLRFEATRLGRCRRSFYLPTTARVFHTGISSAHLEPRDWHGRSGYAAHVGERGVKLSSGQRQRIALAHRLSTIARMDRLVVLDAGRIVEEGTHEELLELGGHYEKLWRHQSGGFIANELDERDEPKVLRPAVG